MKLGVETGEFIKLPADGRGPAQPAVAPVRWVYSVTGKDVVVIEGPDGYPQFVSAEPKSRRRPVANLVI
jgi:hypothetical protein